MKITLVQQRICVMAAVLLALSPATAGECSTLAIYAIEYPESNQTFSTTANIEVRGSAMAGMDPHADVEVQLRILHWDGSQIHASQFADTNANGIFEHNFSAPPWPTSTGWAAVFCDGEEQAANQIIVQPPGGG
jgi:hypothetical protein